MRILPVTSEDFHEWLSMRKTLYSGLDDSFQLEEMNSIFASDEQACYFGKSEQGDIIGMLELSLRNLVDGCVGQPVGYIEGIFLKPEYRGQGQGEKMVAFAESWFKAHGCQYMATDAELTNTAAQSFFRRAGFEETWRIVEFRKQIPESVPS